VRVGNIQLMGGSVEDEIARYFFDSGKKVKSFKCLPKNSINRNIFGSFSLGISAFSK
jgi:hypothetical protein